MNTLISIDSLQKITMRLVRQLK